MKLRELAESASILYNHAHCILHQHLDMKKFYYPMGVAFTDNRLKASLNDYFSAMFKHVQATKIFLRRFVTIKTWIYILSHITYQRKNS